MVYDYSFYAFFVDEIFGSYWLAYFGNAILFTIMGIVGRMSYITLFTLLALYLMVFAIGMLGLAFYTLIFIITIFYLGAGIMKFFAKD